MIVIDGEDKESREESEEDANNGFNLTEEDYDAVQVARDAIRLFLSERRLAAQQVVGLGHALYALERLPKVTSGIYCDYDICYRTGNETYSEMRYISFLISEDEFEISTGGSVYDQSVGSDRISGPGWRIEIGGFADRELGQELYELENSIREYLSLGAKITVDDQSENVEFEEDPE